jgi:acyl dehydratase
MAVDTSIIGSALPPSTIVLERSPISAFAKSVKSTSDIYQNAEVAKANGFTSIPAPPTFGFAFQTFGAFPELQPEGAASVSPALAILRDLSKTGGLILHGEQAFSYHAPVLAGDVLSGTGTISDVYEKTTGSGSVMTFIASKMEYRNAQGEHVLSTVSTLIHKS